MFIRPESAGVIETRAFAAMAMASLAMSGVSASAPALSANFYHKSNPEHTTTHAELATVMVDNTVTLEQLKPHIHKPPERPTPAEEAAKMVTKVEYREWLKVHICEEPSWHVDGPLYAGGLGISRINWAANEGDRFDADEATATPKEQMVVGMKILKANHVSTVPDQIVCSKMGW